MPRRTTHYYEEGGAFEVSKTEPKIVAEFRQKMGRTPIESMKVCRVPIPSMLEKLANILTLGKYNKKKKELNYDSYFHLYLVLKFENGEEYNLEKNERVRISKDIDKKNSTCLQVLRYPPSSLNVDSLLRNAEDAVGGVRLWYYNPLGSAGGDGGNCQTFVFDLLNSSINMTQEMKAFILQDVEAAVAKDSKLHKIMNFATDLKNRFSTFFQGGDLEGGGARIDLIIKIIKELIEMSRGGVIKQIKSRTYIQSIMFKKSYYSKVRANAWLKHHNFKKNKPLHEVKNYLRARLVEPNSELYKYRIKMITPNIKFVYAIHK